MKDNVILDVKNLRTSFATKRGVVKAVDDISFTIHKGETIGIVGESGSGKSVTALTMMGLLPKPHAYIEGGDIILNSPGLGPVDVTKVDEKTMRKIRGEDIAMIFQEPMSSLNPVYTCGDQVMEAIRLHRNVSKKEAKQRTIDLFKKVKLPRPEKIFDTYPHQISGGQKQRVMIAMAMSCDPRVLIADEPTTALDVTVQKNIVDLMKELNEDNDMATIFITHDLGVIAEIADRVVVMYQGKIVEQGPIFNIFNNPQHPYTKGLLACRPRMDVKLRELPTVSDFMELNQEGEIVEKKDSKYKSAAFAVLSNLVSEDEIQEKQLRMLKEQPIIEVRNLKTYFPVKEGIFKKSKEVIKAVDDVSFKVFEGETLGLVGESGCGKTTLGRSMMRLIEPTEGEVLFFGKNILDFNKREMMQLRKDMQIIFQDPYSSLNPRQTIGDAIVEPMRFHNIGSSNNDRKQKAEQLLEEVGLSASFYNRYPHEFSGGQRQRIVIARALSVNPKFIICDESVSALDVSVQAQVLNLLNRLKENHDFTYIFISHDLSVVKFIADRIMVMNEGKIVEAGFSESIYDAPKSDYTIKLMDAIPHGNIEDIRKRTLQRKAKTDTYGY
ncbi:ABC transporter ATP-binding protein [Flammeovirgaceae bacterium KN852]|uniref:ABC transporter ATP-binding protein n=2 Tax=Marinigracilibium pacificum TaxID=2729599 RepID=A0A848J5L1_9BACT|nr:ABC transporter ATP-binding protein [Marinigracilibium pacificum]NMM49754.1 ABC transporter ATP-binding protein [Marinigracilibium pacificum]